MRRLLLWAVLAAACDTRVGADPARVFLLDRVRVDRADAERAAAGFASPSFPCAAILATTASFAKDWERLAPGTRAELEGARRLCYAATLTFGLTRIAKLEAVRRGRDDLVEECSDLEHGIAMLVAMRPTDKAVAGMAGRRKVLCP